MYINNLKIIYLITTAIRIFPAMCSRPLGKETLDWNNNLTFDYKLRDY